MTDPEKLEKLVRTAYDILTSPPSSSPLTDAAMRAFWREEVEELLFPEKLKRVRPMRNVSGVAGVGSGKFAPCERCGRQVEQPSSYPRVVQQFCRKCE